MFSTLTFSILITFTAAQQLVLVQVLYRHGQRTPAEFYPNDTNRNNWPQGIGQLTNIGKRTEYQLGVFLRHKYDAFLDKVYRPTDVHFRSTDVDRTLQSAQLVAAGLYPPVKSQVWNPKLDWQPIPIHTVPIKEDTLLGYKDAYCPRFDQEFDKSLEVEPMKSFLKKYESMFDFLSFKSGMNVDIRDVWIIYDDTLNEKMNNMTEPKWIQKVWRELRAEGNKIFGLMVPTKQMKKLKGGPLVKEMLKNCDLHLRNKSPIKMYHYSAHDTTLGIWLSVMGLFNGQQPPYSSVILFELFMLNATAASSSVNDYGIKISYRNETDGEPSVLTLSGCNEICPLKKVIQLTVDVVPGDIKEECKAVVEDGSNKSTMVKQSTYIILAISAYLIFFMI